MKLYNTLCAAFVALTVVTGVLTGCDNTPKQVTPEAENEALSAEESIAPQIDSAQTEAVTAPLATEAKEVEKNAEEPKNEKTEKKKVRECECYSCYDGDCKESGVGYEPDARGDVYVCEYCMGRGMVQGGEECLPH